MYDDKEYMPHVHYRSLAEFENSYWWHISRVKWAEKIIRAFYPDPTLLHVIDYGCGTGGFLHELNKRVRFKSCVGVDVSNSAIQHAQKYGSNYIQCEPGDLNCIVDEDLVLLMDVLEHIEENNNLLNCIFERLKHKAGVLISVPAMPFLYSSWDKKLGHYRRYTKNELNTRVEKIGGTVKYITYCFTYLLPVIWIKRNLMKAKCESNNCEFPPVHNSVNKVLLMLNDLELFGAKYITYPFGSSLFCLIGEK